MSILLISVVALSALFSVGALVCWVMVMIRFFQRDNILAGLVTFFFPFLGWVIGLVKATEYEMKTLMVWWSIFWLVGWLPLFAFFFFGMVTHGLS
ncbi:MAG: hypothetical protein HN405_02275 [Planctomycetes bacterium]|jgi:hypothetical protein|nr:hypothetical protein [Planctomycetota bacterium]MBT4029124.1 hypothetical protein [Planctomycetota bacterium]MBT4560502.1 hypothetical protein [Planctomycetota bacterium]MBT5100572.1 hypothetical protein [Planctomycetota bacterium]MBT7011679.1 hypothetical protein [Planctomycetota bacterium]